MKNRKMSSLPPPTSTPVDEYPRLLELNRLTAQVLSPQPRLAYHIPFPAIQRTPPSPLSSHFQATFTRQMEAIKQQMHPDLNKFTIPPRSFSIPPTYLSPTIEEIELLTLNSGPQHDIADHIINNVYACSLWDHVQQNLYTAQQLEAMARKHCRQAAIKWE